jgi:uncharacterized protein DUF3606
MERRLKLNNPDTRSINIEDEYALEFWTRELNVSRKKLKDAVLSAGTAVMDVKRELKGRA